MFRKIFLGNSLISGLNLYLRERSILWIFFIPMLWQTDTAQVDQAVEKLSRGPTSNIIPLFELKKLFSEKFSGSKVSDKSHLRTFNSFSDNFASVCI
jgi:hypothetical protein